MLEIMRGLVRWWLNCGQNCKTCVDGSKVQEITSVVPTQAPDEGSDVKVAENKEVQEVVGLRCGDSGSMNCVIERFDGVHDVVIAEGGGNESVFPIDRHDRRSSTQGYDG